MGIVVNGVLRTLWVSSRIAKPIARSASMDGVAKKFYRTVMINNAYPYLLEMHERQLRLDSIRKAVGEGVKDAAPKFGLG